MNHGAPLQERLRKALAAACDSRGRLAVAAALDIALPTIGKALCGFNVSRVTREKIRSMYG